MTMSLSLLSMAVAMGQFRLMDGTYTAKVHSIEFIILLIQSVFSFIVSGCLFLWTVGLAMVTWLQRARPEADLQPGKSCCVEKQDDNNENAKISPGDV